MNTRARPLSSSSGFRSALAALLLGGCLGCATTIPLPPELKRDPIVVKSSSSRVIVMGRMKPFKIEPYRLMDLMTGTPSSQGMSFSVGMSHYMSSIGFAWEKARSEGAFSFGLEKEGSEGTLVRGVCQWGVATTSGALSFGSSGVEYHQRDATSIACEFADAPDAEPWRLLLWTGPPSNPVSPKIPSGGALLRGDVRYEANSTNVIESIAIGAPYLTGTLFLRDGQAVAAVERVLPGRIVMQPSLAPEEQSLFVAVGAALFVYDFQSHAFTP